MHKILLIIKREYLTRVRKKSFIIMTILGPLLMAALMIVPIWLLQNTGGDTKILVADDSGYFAHKLKDGKKIKFEFTPQSVEEVKSMVDEFAYDGVLCIPKMNINNPVGVEYISENTVGIEVKSYIERKIEDRIRLMKIDSLGLDQALLNQLKTNVNIKSKALDKEDTVSTTTASITGLVSAIVIYFFIFMYGAQVMRGVIEEKTSRVIEVIVSSVKPFQLMMGKVVGIGLVGLTQFLLWIFLTVGVSTAVSSVFDLDRYNTDNIATTMAESRDAASLDQAMDYNQMYTAISSLDIPMLLFSFVFYFIGGYLIYGALFAAVGSAVDSEADTQQFMLPITIPMILGIMVAQTVIQNPEGPLAFWFSIIPFTSPIIMMTRLPFIGFGWEVVLSMVLLVLTFLGTIWVAGRIYRVGILMYGKKVNFKEIGKWLFYKA